jgi:RimJ/RimL family protein N-acetyltransferase
MEIKPVVLEGRLVRLEPLSEAHISELFAAGNDEEIWRYMRYGEMRAEADMRLWVLSILELAKQGTDLPFAVIDRPSGSAIGATRYLDIQPQNRAAEIGGTWYGTAYQRTGVNTECKYLLLRHAFEALGCIRVQFKADLRNDRSQRALERIGAVREGVLRDHIILPDGYRRSSVYYSILDVEWQGVKATLERLLDR